MHITGPVVPIHEHVWYVDVLLLQGDERVSHNTLQQLVDNINRAQTSWRAALHRPFAGKTHNEMLRIRGGKR
jgi:hypothetical protein